MPATMSPRPSRARRRSRALRSRGSCSTTSTSQISTSGRSGSPTTGWRSFAGRRRSWQRARRARVLGAHPVRRHRPRVEGLADVLVRARRDLVADLTEEELEARKSMIDTDPPPHTRMRARQQGPRARRQRVRGAYPGLARDPHERVRAGRVRLGRVVAAEIPMWVFSEIMGLLGRGPSADHRAGDKILGNTDPVVGGVRRRAGAAGSRAPQAPLLEPVLARPDRVRPRRRAAARRLGTTSRPSWSRRSSTGRGCRSRSSA